MENNKEEQVQQQKDTTPKWQKTAIIIVAIGTCSTAIAALIGLFGDAPGQCIKNNNYTKNHKKRLDIEFDDMVRRDQYQRKYRTNG